MPDERFAGLPDQVAEAAKMAPVSYVEYTLPEDKLGMVWDMEDEFRTFRMVELTPAMQHAAAKLSKDNASVLQQELMFRAITRIGSMPTAKDRDLLERWWRAIGPKCRMLVTSAFSEMVSVDEADTAAFLDTGRPGGN